MKTIHVNITSNLSIVPNLDQLLPNEFATVQAWAEQGILVNLFTKDDNTGAILVFKDVDEAKIKELLNTLPLHSYFVNVAFTAVEKHI